MKQITLNCFSSLDEITDEQLITNEQLLVINFVNEKYNICNYSLKKIFAKYAYEIKTSGTFFDPNGMKSNVKISNFIKINNKFYETYFSHSYQKFEEKNLGFRQKKYSKTIISNLAFKIEEHIIVDLSISIIMNSKNVRIEKKILLYDNKQEEYISISHENNFDIIFNHFLSLCEENKEKDEFVLFFNISKFTIDDYIKDDKKTMYKQIKKFFVTDQKIITKRSLDNMLKNSFNLNENTKCYFPFTYWLNNVIFTFTDNENNIIENYKPTEQEKSLLRFMTKYYLNSYKNYDVVINPFTGKITRKNFYVLYDSNTGIVLGKGGSRYPYKYYLKYNNIIYEEDKNDNLTKLIDEYDMFKKLMN